MTDANVLTKGEVFPGPIPALEGAVCELLRDGAGTLYIYIHGLNKREAKALAEGDMRCGVLSEGASLMLIFEFIFRGNSIFSFDCVFDARRIPEHELQIPEITDPRERYFMTVLVIDTHTKILKSIRGVTMSHQLTLEFFSAVQDQLASSETGDRKIKQWLDCSAKELLSMAKMRPMGTAVDSESVRLGKDRSDIQ